jgi:taurine--2-oxoglutarate transaminase
VHVLEDDDRLPGAELRDQRLGDSIRNGAGLDEPEELAAGSLCDVHDRAERPWREERIAGADEDASPTVDREQERLDERGLADAGLAADEDEPPRPALGIQERIVERGERALPLQELARGEPPVGHEAHAAIVVRSSTLRNLVGASIAASMATIEVDPNLGAQIVEDAKDFVLYSWSVQDAIQPIAVAGAEGRSFWDYDGKRYLDFASQLVNVNIGHQHPKIITAIKEQADRLCTIGPPLASESRSRLGRMLAEVTPGDLCMSFFTNSGAEANENAIKLARLSTGRHKIVARYRSYHGATHGSILLTGDPRRWPNEPGMGGVVRMLDPYTYRCPAGHPVPCPVCTGAPHLEEILEYEGAQTVAAVILETVTGTNGVIPPPPGYLQAVREVCDRHGILLILDEVMAGFGRTGRWFACENWDVVPDIITVAKGINSGYVPLGAMIIREHLKEWVRSRFFPGGLTYAGHPLACASAVASIEAFQEEGVVENAAEVGAYLGERLRDLALGHPSIGEVRGLGCFWGVELVKNRDTREMLVPFNASGDAAAPVARLAKAALERGLYLMTHWNVIMVVPPLTITRDEVDEGVAILDEALAVADEFVV